MILFYRNPYYWIFIACWCLWGLSELTHSFITNDAGKGAQNKYSTVLIYLGIVLLMAIGFSGGYLPRFLVFKDLALPLFIAGIAMELGALALRWISVFVMGDAFSRKIRVEEGQEIIKSGPFAYIRHPNYLAGLLTFSSFGLIFGTWFSLVTCFLLGFFIYRYRIKVEERFLRKHLDQYETYCREVEYRLIPYIY